jgi:uncharacterized protein (DUF58 family)
VIRRATPRLARLLSLAGLAALLGVLLGLPELVAVAVVLAIPVVAGIAATDAPDIDSSVTLSADRCLEGEEVEVSIQLRCTRGGRDLEVGLPLPAGMRVVDGAVVTVVSLQPNEPRTITLRLRAERWGGKPFRSLTLRAHGPGRLVAFDELRRLDLRLAVYPGVDRLLRGTHPLRTQVFAGNHVARVVGDGIEFASVRAYAPGDSIRRVNWRVTSRRGVLHVDEHHPERNADVILFLDTFSDVGPVGRSSLDNTVRGAAALARHQLGRKDRVGMVGFGGTVSWLRVGMGETQFLRLLASLLDVSIALSYSWKDVDALPRRALPPLASFVVFSPLLDARALRAITDLCGRGHDVTVVDTLDEDAVLPSAGRRGLAAHRVWRLLREDRRAQLAEIGVPVVAWTGEDSLAAALAMVPRDARRTLRVGV